MTDTKRKARHYWDKGTGERSLNGLCHTECGAEDSRQLLNEKGETGKGSDMK